MNNTQRREETEIAVENVLWLLKMGVHPAHVPNAVGVQRSSQAIEHLLRRRGHPEYRLFARNGK